MTEYEKKILISYDEYITLLKIMCKNAAEITQTNYYFDTDDYAMNKQGITYRVREKNGKYQATIKQHDKNHIGLSTEIDFSEKTELDLDIFSSFGVSLKGTLVTNRIVLHKDSYCQMVLDSNSYLGEKDYEIEIEYINGHEDRANSLLMNIADVLFITGIIKSKEEIFMRVGKAKNKSERFFYRKQAN